MTTIDDWGLSTIGANPIRFVPVEERKIQCIDLDTFIANHGIPKVHFMKLDTEGSELLILRGARNMIMRDHPIMIIEYYEPNMKQCGISKEELHDFLIETGYKWELISTDDILCIPNQQYFLS